MRWQRIIFIAFSVIFSAGVARTQSHSSFDIHGLKPGMIAREIILYSHAPLDTVFWDGKEGANIFGFKGEWLGDTGEFRVALGKNEITQITFTSNPRTTGQNVKAVEGILARIKKLYGKPEDYHNVYRIVTWKEGNEQLKLTTSDGGVFYTVTLSVSQP
jgi:hypothetical protein